MVYFRAFLALLSSRLSLAELRSATSCFETVLSISMVRFSLILRAFSHFLLSVVLFLNHRNRWFFIEILLVQSIIHYLEKFLWFIILDPRVNVHSCLIILMPCQILNCLWGNARIEQMRRIERFKYCSVNRIDIFQRERPFPYRTFFRSIPLFMFNCIRFPCLL